MADQEVEKHSLTPEQMQIALNWLMEKWGDGSPSRPAPKCEMCQVVKWSIIDQLVSPITVQGHTLNLKTALPQIMVLCTNCGNIKYLNAMACGVVKPDEQKKQPEEKPDVN